MSRTLGLSPVQRWGKVIVPSLAPGITLGVWVASSVALIVTLLVDIFGTGAGVGRLLVESQQRFDASLAWGLLLMVGTFGYLTSVLLTRLGRRVAVPGASPARMRAEYGTTRISHRSRRPTPSPRHGRSSSARSFASAIR
jgi:sulfonate transport system permease protein